MMRKKSKNSNGRTANSDEKAFQRWLKDRRCVVSVEYGAEVHHMYGSTFVNNKVLIGHWACIPLHHNYHRGFYGIHTIGSKAWVNKFGQQCSFWEKEINEFEQEIGIICPPDVRQSIMNWGK